MSGFVKQRLRQLGRTQTELARELAYTPSYINKVINGQYQADHVLEAVELVLDRWEAGKEASHGA